jgi:uncharacterized protein involved in exopolysaccharide biosynthesis
MEMREPDNITLRDALDILFKRKGHIALFFIATVATVAIGTFLVQPTFEASAQILVKLGRESVFVPASGNTGPIINYDREERINSEIEILKSKSLAEKVVAVLGPTVLYEKLKDENPGIMTRLRKKLKGFLKKPAIKLTPSEKVALRFETALSYFQKALKVEGIKKSNVIQIKFKHHDPRFAAIVVNTLAENYLEHHLEVHKVPQSYDFFQEQAELLKSKMKQAQEKLRTLKKQHNISSLDEQRTLLLREEAELRSSLNITLSQIVETEKRIRQVRQQLAATPKLIPHEAETDQNQELISTLEARLVELELEEKKLLTKYTDQSRLVHNVKDEIHMVREKLAEHHIKRYEKKTSGTNLTYQRLQEKLYQNEAELNALIAKSETQKVQLEGYQRKLENLNRIEGELKHLQQEVDVDHQNYRLYLAKFEETRISDAMDSEKISSVNIIEKPRTPIRPVSPKVVLNLALAFFLGTFGGFALAFLMEYLDDGLKRPEEVENYLGVPVLASIPELKA